MPENMDTVKKLDDFFKDLLFFFVFFKKKKINKQNLENIFEKLQNKARAVMGSLAKLWEILEDAKQAEDKAAQISVQIFSTMVHQLGKCGQPWK